MVFFTIQKLVKDWILQIVLADVGEPISDSLFSELIDGQSTDPTRSAVEDCCDTQLDKIVDITGVMLVPDQNSRVFPGRFNHHGCRDGISKNPVAVAKKINGFSNPLTNCGKTGFECRNNC